jgi:hypothetical protein
MPAAMLFRYKTFRMLQSDLTLKSAVYYMFYLIPIPETIENFTRKNINTNANQLL